MWLVHCWLVGLIQLFGLMSFQHVIVLTTYHLECWMITPPYNIFLPTSMFLKLNCTCLVACHVYKFDFTLFFFLDAEMISHLQFVDDTYFLWSKWRPSYEHKGYSSLVWSWFEPKGELQKHAHWGEGWRPAPDIMRCRAKSLLASYLGVPFRIWYAPKAPWSMVLEREWKEIGNLESKTGQLSSSQLYQISRCTSCPYSNVQWP